MKKFEFLGRALSRAEQRNVMGGNFDGGGGPLCGTGRIGTCSCGGPVFNCCIDCPNGNVHDETCITNNGCSMSNYLCSHNPCS